MDQVSAIRSITTPSDMNVESISSANPSAGKSEPAEFQALLELNEGAKPELSPEQLKEKQAIADLASVIARQFVEVMFEEQQGITGGDEFASQQYHQMLVGALAEQLTLNDSLGFKAMIESEVID